MRHFAAILLALPLLTGCIAPHVTMPGATDNHYNSELPPLPPTYETPKASLRSSLVGEAATPEPFIGPMLTIAWNHDGQNVDGFRVYQATTPTMSDMQVLTNVSGAERQVRFQSGQLGFLGVKAYNATGESGWGTTQQ